MVWVWVGGGGWGSLVACAWRVSYFGSLWNWPNSRKVSVGLHLGVEFGDFHISSLAMGVGERRTATGLKRTPGYTGDCIKSYSEALRDSGALICPTSLRHGKQPRAVVLAEKFVTSGDAWVSDTVVRTDLCGGIVSCAIPLPMLTASRRAV